MLKGPDESTVTWEEWEATQAEVALTSSIGESSKLESDGDTNGVSKTLAVGSVWLC